MARYVAKFVADLTAEIVARAIVGCAAGGLVFFFLLPGIAGEWGDGGCLLLLIPLTSGVVAAIYRVRKGPGVI